MDTITETETPSTDIVIIDEAAQVEDRSNDSFGKDITKTLLVSVATTAIMTGGVFAASYANAKFQQFRTMRALKKKYEAAEAKVVDITSMQDAPKQD